MAIKLHYLNPAWNREFLVFRYVCALDREFDTVTEVLEACCYDLELDRMINVVNDEIADELDVEVDQFSR